MCSFGCRLFLISKAWLERERGANTETRSTSDKNKDPILFPGHVERKDVPVVTKR